jgi:hypothetical protein
MAESTTESPQPPPPAASGLPFVAKLIGGFVLVAIVVGIGLVARAVGDDELSLPDRVGGLNANDSDAALDGIPEDKRKLSRDNSRASYEYNSEKLSDAFDGAEAVTRVYGTIDGDSSLTVTAVRAETGPPLPVTFDNPEVLGTAAPRFELVDEGDATCLVGRNPAPRTDGEPTEEQLAPSTVLCQRSGGDLTVRVYGVSEPDLDDVADATNEVWDELK